MEKQEKGFRKIDAERQKAIASLGGKAAHAQGTAHKFTSEEARAAGKKGGAAHSKEHLASIGRLGGLARGKKIES